MRLDRRLRATHPSHSWRKLREAVERGQVTVDGRVVRDPGRMVGDDSAVAIDWHRPADRRVRAPFPILHEDEDVLVIDKPAGLLSIPSAPGLGGVEDTVLRRVREYIGLKRGGAGRRVYAGMLHRLDRDTSGALAVALSKDAHAKGRDLFRHHRFERRYLAIVEGVPDPPRGTIDARISSTYRAGRRAIVGEDRPGLPARTDYAVRDRFGHAALVELTLHTGRQHQIRLHLQSLGHPLVGERVYETPRPPALRHARRRPSSRPLLHAWTLAFPHPITGARISVEAPLPDDFARTLDRLSRGAEKKLRDRAID